MGDRVELARPFYAAMQNLDVDAVRDALASAFILDVSEGMRFAHILRFRDAMLIELRQITDTRRWEQALAPDEPPRCPSSS